MKKRAGLWIGAAAGVLAAAAAGKKAGVPEQVKKWISFHPLAPKVNRNMPRIACIGDSITYGAGVEKMRGQRSYPALLEGLLGGRYQVLNYGLNGRTVLADGNRPYTKEPFYALSRRCGAECFILMLGTNDTKPINWNAEAYEPELEAFVRSYLELPNHPKVFVMQPSRCFAVDGADGVAYEIRNEIIRDEVYPAVARVAERTGAGLIDLYRLTDGHPEYFDDGVHPNYKGNQEIARRIAAHLEGERD